MDSDEKQNVYRLWIGNLDSKLTEFSFLKVLQKLPIKIEKFDMAYHKYGPEKGKCKGYAFVMVSKMAEAEVVMRCLEGKLFNGRRLRVKPAQLQRRHKTLKLGLSTGTSSAGGSGRDEKAWRIRQIESKLKMMQDERSIFNHNNNDNDNDNNHIK